MMSDVTPVNGTAWLDRVDNGDSRSLESAMSRAVNLDHPCTDLAGCDIARARAEGFTWVAAYLLMGATETPHISMLMAVFPAGTFPVGHNPQGWDEWGEFHERYGVPCTACNGYTYGDDSWTPDTCSDCLQPLPVPCTHGEWVAGMMVVSLDDLQAVAEARQRSSDTLPECRECGHLYHPYNPPMIPARGY